MLYVLYNSADIEQVEKEIIPLLGDRNCELVSYVPGADLNPENNSLLLTFLNDEILRELIPRAAKNDWTVGILPHPKSRSIIKGLGITKDVKETVEEILNTEECNKMDILFCNGLPVFQSVNIGNVFALTKESRKDYFASEVLNFFKNIRRLPSLSHKPFTISSSDEKIINTSALGIIVVEHAMSSVVSKRLISKSSINDGQFNVLILSPNNMLDLFWFLIQSLLPNTKTLEKLPSFIGQIKIGKLKIENQPGIEYTIDGIAQTASEINLEVAHKALNLKQASIYAAESNGNNNRNSIQVDKLPTGEKRIALTKRKLPLLPRATTEEFQDLFKLLRNNARASSPFVVMMILSTLIATFGLFGNSSPVIIGAMILAPIISPIVSFSMGMVRYDVEMLKTGFVTILIGTLVSLIFAAGVSIIIPLEIVTSEIDDRLSPTLLDMGIAVASGIAAAYAHAKAGIAKSLAGVAIAVALVPPLAVAGIGIGWMDWDVFSGAILLYFTNLSGIIMFAGLTFLILGFAPFRTAKMGLVYTAIIIAIVIVPLSLSFNRIQLEAKITRQLEGSAVEEVILRDVKVRFGDPLKVSLKLVSGQDIGTREMKKIKTEIENKVGRPVNLEVISAIEI